MSRQESDTIYRQAAIDALWKVHQNRQLDSDRWVIADCLREIDGLPSARPETTRKVLASSRGGTTMWYKCEKCGQVADQSDNYCRCCGRRFLNG